MNKSLIYVTSLSLEMATLRAYYMPEVSSHKLSSPEPVDPLLVPSRAGLWYTNILLMIRPQSWSPT